MALRYAQSLSSVSFWTCLLLASGTAFGSDGHLGGEYKNIFQTSATGSSCVGNSSCNVVFSNVQQSKRLVITQVTCALNATGSGQTYPGALYAKSNPSLFESLIESGGYENTSSSVIALASSAQFYVDAGDAPVVGLSLAQGTFTQNPTCFISGEMDPN